MHDFQKRLVPHASRTPHQDDGDGYYVLPRTNLLVPFYLDETTAAVHLGTPEWPTGLCAEDVEAKEVATLLERDGCGVTAGVYWNGDWFYGSVQVYGPSFRDAVSTLAAALADPFADVAGGPIIAGPHGTCDVTAPSGRPHSKAMVAWEAADDVSGQLFAWPGDDWQQRLRRAIGATRRAAPELRWSTCMHLAAIGASGGSEVFGVGSLVCEVWLEDYSATGG